MRTTKSETFVHPFVKCGTTHNLHHFSFSDLNIKDHVGNTPLHVAVENESMEVVDYLLQRSVTEK